MSFPCLNQLIPALALLLRGFKASLDSGHFATGWQQDKCHLPLFLHSVHCGQDACHCHPTPCDPLLYSMVSSWAVLAVRAYVLSKHTSQCIPSAQHEEEEQFAVQRLSTPDRPCQEFLYSLPHQPSWLHHTCDSVKGYRRFPHKTYRYNKHI